MYSLPPELFLLLQIDSILFSFLSSLVSSLLVYCFAFTQGSFKSSIRRSPKSATTAASILRSSSKRRCKKELSTSNTGGIITSETSVPGSPDVAIVLSDNVRHSPSPLVAVQQQQQQQQETTAASTEICSDSASLIANKSASSCSPATAAASCECTDVHLMKASRCTKSHLIASSASPPFSSSSHRSFTIKPIPSSTTKPLLVFINPKSGGNQGSKLIQKFQWLLNPRQVFDLSQVGPKVALELYRKVPNLRILACGGDGTIGWIFSALDDLTIKPSVAVLPLGTGNDLARAFGWGGSYTDEPLSKILFNVRDGEIVQLDRWDLVVERNYNTSGCEIQPDRSSTSSGGGSSDPLEDVKFETTNINARETLPTNVINNYFSIGVDAHIALEFHEAREAHPEKFNSRLRNKMFYGQAGGKDLLQRKWKDLCNYITLECDGVDLTQRLKDLKVHSLLFLNIPSYGGGTRPWSGNSPVYEVPRTDDGLIEVIGLTTYQLVSFFLYSPVCFVTFFLSPCKLMRLVYSVSNCSFFALYLSRLSHNSLFSKLVVMVRASRNVEVPLLLRLELYRCKLTVNLVDYYHL